MAYFIKVSYTEALTLLTKHRASPPVVGPTGHWMIYIVCPWLCPVVIQVNTNDKHRLVHHLTIYKGEEYYKVLGSPRGDSLRERADTFFWYTGTVEHGHIYKVVFVF